LGGVNKTYLGNVKLELRLQFQSQNGSMVI
jgi:hypothetical protein